MHYIIFVECQFINHFIVAVLPWVDSADRVMHIFFYIVTFQYQGQTVASLLERS